MKHVYTCLVLSTIFTSCAMRIDYLGSTSPPTNSVDVYVDPSAIKRPYTIIGKGYPSQLGTMFKSTEKLQRKATEIAWKKGADAILFQDYFVQHEGTNFYSASRVDSVGKGVVTTTSGSVSPTDATGRNILFLRYD
ncbi:MAG: hypothetical protein EOO10_15545 [Chitinophagaceae bacterium]|nr:MAG: hypothetical protein EOO10_15545 [Chitinophagaceae bacterium]